MGKHLVLVGGGHAHMVSLANLNTFIDKGHHVTVIGPSEYHYYSGMGPGMLGRTYKPEEIRFATRHVVEKKGGTFVLDKVTHIDPDGKTVFLESGEKLNYDVLSFNAGSFVPWVNNGNNKGNAEEDIYTVKPIEKLMEAGDRIKELSKGKNLTVAVIGGGAAAVEMAGNTFRLLNSLDPGRHRVILFSGNKLLKRFPEKVRRAAAKAMKRLGISVYENDYVTGISTREISLESGKSFQPDLIFIATGVRPSLIFKNSGLPIGLDGGLLVNEYLQSTGYKEIFGGGDCIYFEKQPLDKVGVYAVRQNPVLYNNLMATLEETPLTPFKPGGSYLLIFNMGDGTGIFYKNGLSLTGPIAFKIKDYIDRRFMKKFQAIE